MVEITLPLVLQILQTIGILVGIIYYITTMRNSQRTQQQALDARRTEIFLRRARTQDVDKTIIIIALVILSWLFGKAFQNSFYFTDSWKYEVTPYDGEPKTLTIHITQEELSEYTCFAQTLQTADENGLTYIEDFNASSGALSEYWSWLESLNIEYHYPFIIETDSGDYLVHVRTFGGLVSDDWWLGYTSLLCLLTIPLLLFRWSRQT